MADPNQFQEDLHFVRQAVARKGQDRSPVAVMWIVAVYVLIGYTLLDIALRWAGWFFAIGGIGMWGLMTLVSRRQIQREGEIDRKRITRLRLHWGVGIALAVASCIGLAIVNPAFRGQALGQLIVVMMGLIYFLGGIHFDRQFLWLGPILIVGGLCVRSGMHFGWTTLGIVIALGLVVPTFFRRHDPHNDDSGPGQDSVQPA